MTGMRLSRCTRSISEAPPRGTMMSMIPLILSIRPTAARARVGTSCTACTGRPAERVGLGGDVFEATGDRFEARRVEREPIQQGGADAGLLRLGKIFGIGG